MSLEHPALPLTVVTVTGALVLCPLLEDRGRITESIRILVPVERMKQKCFQITTKRVRRSQQFQLRQQPVPCSRCSNRKGSVANSSTCSCHDEVATRWSAILLKCCWLLKTYLFCWALRHLVTVIFGVHYRCTYLLTNLLIWLPAVWFLDPQQGDAAVSGQHGSQGWWEDWIAVMPRHGRQPGKSYRF